MRETFLEFTDKLKLFFSEFFDGHPLRMYLGVMSVLLLYQYGLIRDWDWTVPSPTLKQGFWMNFIFENYSRKTYRIVLSIINILTMLFISFLFYSKYVM